MAHWARIDENNIVQEVLVTATDHRDGNEGGTWLVEKFGGTWIKTSFNTHGGQHLTGGTPLRKNFASVDFIYDADRDAFYAPSPFPSWVLDEDTCLWEPPIPRPTSGMFAWDEDALNWKIIGE